MSLWIGQFQLCPTPPPPGYSGAFAHRFSPGGGTFANFARCPGAGHWLTPGPTPNFWHARFPISINITFTEDFTGKTSRLAHLSRTEKKLKRVGNVCSRFYACISSLLIKPELHSEMGIYWQESTFFWLLNQISVDIIWRTSFRIYKTIPNSQLYSALLILKSIIL